MQFKEAFVLMKEGKKVGLKDWKGYWKWENNTIMMCCKDGLILDILQTKDVDFTMSNICSEEWEIKE